MRKNFMVAALCSLVVSAAAQDSLKTTTLQEVVVSGTKFELPVEKSGKTIVKLSKEDLERNAGKTLADVLNEVPGIQMDGNFSTPGSNVSYYLRGGRNKHTLILIDGVPLNDPSAINAEYDLRYIPVSQIESIEVLKGGLSTLYGTNAAAGVISIKLKAPAEKFSGFAELTAGSFGTYGQNVQVDGKNGKLSYLFSGSNLSSEGFSAAEDNDPAVEFDKDGFGRQNGLLKIGYQITNRFKLNLHSAYEQFKAAYDDYEFADAPNRQKYDQFRTGLTSQFTYGKGEIEGKVFFNTNERRFFSAFPSEARGKNWQGEIIHRHQFSKTVQMLSGVNYQRLAFDQKTSVSADTTNFTMIDPYASLLLELPVGFNLHAGVRVNTHSLYGAQYIYNVNPSFTLNQNGDFKYKIYVSTATSYITPSLYQLYSSYGNKQLNPEQSVNYEAGLAVYGDRLSLNGAAFKRDETDPIDFVSLFDEEGNYIGGQYRNLVSEREVKGLEFSADYKFSSSINVAANWAWLTTDQPVSFYKIPTLKYGATVNIEPIKDLTVSLKYNFTGDRTTFDFNSFTEVQLKEYDLVDLFASYKFMNGKLNVYGAINNVFDEDFIAVFGYTTRGRNYNLGLRYSF